MQASLLTTLLLPLALGGIMFGLGLGLTVEDFRRVARYPRAVLVGLALQIGVLPWAALGLALLFRLPPELAVGLMLLAASPGGATANIYSHIARGDVALNITLTAVNSLLCLVTLPIILNLSLEFFLGAGRYVPPPTRKIVEVALIIVLPVSIGMLVRAYATGPATKVSPVLVTTQISGGKAKKVTYKLDGRSLRAKKKGWKSAITPRTASGSPMPAAMSTLVAPMETPVR